MVKKKKVKTMAELTKDFNEPLREDGKNAFAKVIKKAVNPEKPN